MIAPDEGTAMRGCLWSLLFALIICWAGAMYLILWLVREFSR